jgi:hypothetical protein
VDHLSRTLPVSRKRNCTEYNSGLCIAC